MTPVLRRIPLWLALAALVGCQVPPEVADALDPKPAYAPRNHRGDTRLPDDMQRIAVLPVFGGTVAAEESTLALDDVLFAALQKQMRFELVPVSREECRRLFGATEFSSVSALPHGFLEKLAAHYAVDGVLFTDLTVYRPYQPLALGYRSKLATTREVRIVWAYDEVFSAEDPRMRQSVRTEGRGAATSTLVDPAPAVLQSPARFGAIAANLMFDTLPVR